jgi:DNA-binding transcriptional ArsR family regulator
MKCLLEVHSILNSVVTPLKVSKALADETRLGIFQAICATGHMNCGEIVSKRRVTPATVSHHIRILSDAGLIVCRREGPDVKFLAQIPGMGSIPIARSSYLVFL